MEAHLFKHSDGQVLERTIHGKKGKVVNILFQSSDIIAFYSELAPGDSLPPERHDVVEVIFRLQGKTNHYVNEREFCVADGMTLEIPQYAMHSCSVLGSETVKQITLLARHQCYGDFFDLSL